MHSIACISTRMHQTHLNRVYTELKTRLTSLKPSTPCKSCCTHCHRAKNPKPMLHSKQQALWRLLYVNCRQQVQPGAGSGVSCQIASMCAGQGVMPDCACRHWQSSAYHSPEWVPGSWKDHNVESCPECRAQCQGEQTKLGFALLDFGLKTAYSAGHILLQLACFLHIWCINRVSMTICEEHAQCKHAYSFWTCSCLQSSCKLMRL